ncbi:DNA polymerase III subunit epsilon, partial [bacterium]|nr:DNA polymerase III subunit epsilon [bacterium]
MPALRPLLDTTLQVEVMKGRSNYLCPRRLASARRRKPTSIAELLTLAKILVWLQTSDSGDRGEINLRNPDEHVSFQRLSAQDENCTLHRCETAMQGTCPFYKARKRAEAAHLLIVNHALLMADAV